VARESAEPLQKGLRESLIARADKIAAETGTESAGRMYSLAFRFGGDGKGEPTGNRQ